MGCEVALTNRVVTVHEESLAGEIRGAAAEPMSAVPPATTMFFSVLMDKVPLVEVRSQIPSLGLLHELPVLFANPVSKLHGTCLDLSSYKA